MNLKNQKTPKTQNSSSPEKKKPAKRKITLSDGTLVITDDNKKKDIKTGKLTKHVVPKKKFSTETGKGYEDYEVEDNLDDELDYPPPSKHPLFRKYWADSIDSITSRSNFQPAHLGIYETYCRLRVELKALDDFIAENGHVFRIVTVLGEQRKTYPEVSQRNTVMNMIARYSTMLDLLPKKDKSKGAAKPKEQEEWD